MSEYGTGDTAAKEMDYSAAIKKIMPLVEDGDTTTPFIISRQDGDWIVNYPAEKAQEALSAIQEKDPLAVAFTGTDFAKGSFSYVYDKVLTERLWTEYKQAQYGAVTLMEFSAIANLIEDCMSDLSSDVVEFLTTLDRPLYELNELKPFSIQDENSDFGYSEDKVDEFIEFIENHVEQRLNEPENYVSEKYYKIVSSIKDNFGAYAMAPMYDEVPSLATYESARPSPSVGDYIIFDKQHTTAVRLDDYYGDAEYKAFNTPKKAEEFISRNRSKLMEVPKKVFLADFKIAPKIRELEHMIISIKDHIEDIQGKSPLQKLFSANKELKKAKAALSAAESKLSLLQADYKKLMDEGSRYDRTCLTDSAKAKLPSETQKKPERSKPSLLDGLKEAKLTADKQNAGRKDTIKTKSRGETDIG